MSLFDDLPEPSLSCSVSGELETKPDRKCDTFAPANCRRSENSSLICSSVARKGERPEMQDAHTLIEDLHVYFRDRLTDEVSRLAYFAVFDGHGGCKASAFAAKRLHLHICSRFPKSGLSQIDKDIKRILFDAFKKTDEDFLREACQQRPHWRDGSTASVALIVNNTIYIANLGDSKVVLARGVSPTPDGDSADSNSTGSVGNGSLCHLSTICLTRDHNPMDYDERQRIQATGATVQNGRVNNILEVSRSFGDYQFKKQGVICLPDVKKCQLTQHDRFLLIACDGLWKTVPPEEAVALTNRFLLKELDSLTIDLPARSTKDVNAASNPTNRVLTQRNVESVCNQLVNEAVLRMSGDNVTCILIVFPDAFNKASSVTSPLTVAPILSHTSTTDAYEAATFEPPSKMSKCA